MKRRLAETGFTLIELLITLVVTSMITATVVTLYINTQRTETVQQNLSNLQQNLRVGMGQMIRDLRMAGFAIDNSLATLNTTAGTPYEPGKTYDSQGYTTDAIYQVDNQGNFSTVAVDDIDNLTCFTPIVKETLRPAGTQRKRLYVN